MLAVTILGERFARGVRQTAESGLHDSLPEDDVRSHRQPTYNELLPCAGRRRCADGLTRMGTSVPSTVEHLDDYHIDMGGLGHVQHICEFAERHGTQPCRSWSRSR